MRVCQYESRKLAANFCIDRDSDTIAEVAQFPLLVLDPLC